MTNIKQNIALKAFSIHFIVCLFSEFLNKVIESLTWNHSELWNIIPAHLNINSQRKTPKITVYFSFSCIFCVLWQYVIQLHKSINKVCSCGAMKWITCCWSHRGLPVSEPDSDDCSYFLLYINQLVVTEEGQLHSW